MRYQDLSNDCNHNFSGKTEENHKKTLAWQDLT